VCYTQDFGISNYYGLIYDQSVEARSRGVDLKSFKLGLSRIEAENVGSAFSGDAELQYEELKRLFAYWLTNERTGGDNVVPALDSTINRHDFIECCVARFGASRVLRLSLWWTRQQGCNRSAGT
jgi:hypothetical protein